MPSAWRDVVPDVRGWRDTKGRTIRAMYDFGVGVAIAIGIDVVLLFTLFPAWQ